MNYNIHPIFVHFPIALLLFYSVIKILPLSRWFPSVAWKHVERALLAAGVVGAALSMSTGELAEELTQPNRQLVEMHSTFAAMSTWIYGALLAGEFAAVVRANYANFLSIPFVQKVFTLVETILCHRVLSSVLAFIGLITITVTGLLGGVMVYGTSADPLAAVVLKLLGISF